MSLQQTLLPPATLAACREKSARLREWLEKHHGPMLVERVFKGKPIRLEVTGSRRAGVDLAYPESDLDLAYIADTPQELTALCDQLIEAHQRGEVYEGCHLERLTTRAGLPWCPIEGVVDEHWEKGVTIGPIKLDVTFRTTETHDLIRDPTCRLPW